MKKFLLIAAIFAFILMFYGCGQNLDITVYNAVPVAGAQWIMINGHTEHHDQWMGPTSFADKSDECDNTNSMSFQSPENDTLHVAANGERYVIDSTGNTTIQSYTVPDTTQVLYGGLLEQPHWYAEVNLTSVIIFKK
jgi:hypothetical protein